ncbi:MAG: molybdenum cofactor guanylyltransferase [Halioglobus sp.]|nr:molybdenum cofactor guanylyltransferase [Halioglobus sp.]
MPFDSATDTPGVTGLILAGGAGRRVNRRDKGLIPWRGEPLVAHVCRRIRPQVGKLIISCNRNEPVYRNYTKNIVRDIRGSYQGPLAGIEAALDLTTSPHLLVVGCDMPLLPVDLVTRLYTALDSNSTLDACFAHDGERSQYLCALIRNNSLRSLKPFLDSGERTVHHWYRRMNTVGVDFSDCPEAFSNLNRLT